MSNEDRIRSMFLLYVPKSGQCFTNAIHSILSNKGKLIVVHGITKARDRHKKIRTMMHGWAEDDDFVYDFNFHENKMVQVDKEIYYRAGEIQVKNTVRYSLEEVIDNIVMHEHAGPWVFW